MEVYILGAVALACLIASLSWARSAYFQYGFLRSMQREVKREEDQSEDEREDMHTSTRLARLNFRKEIHSASLYAGLALSSVVVAATGSIAWAMLFVLVIPPAIISTIWSGGARREIFLTQQSIDTERRAVETITQGELAPRAWADRLAPEVLPEFAGLEIGRLYQAAAGLMAGDFYDIFKLSDSRVAVVIGDVAGKNIESSITAFQAKYLLRVFLLEFRDPAQALEEMNRQMFGNVGDDFVSLVVAIFDSEANTVRYVSAGHPIVWFYHNREIQALESTGPLLMMTEDSKYYSRELPLNQGDVILMYTDGLFEVRKSDELLGEERVGDMLYRDPTVPADELCQNLLETAQGFSDRPISDDVAIIAIRATPEWGGGTISTNGLL